MLHCGSLRKNKMLIKVLHRILRINKHTQSMATELYEKECKLDARNNCKKLEANEVKGTEVYKCIAIREELIKTNK